MVELFNLSKLKFIFFRNVGNRTNKPQTGIGLISKLRHKTLYVDYLNNFILTLTAFYIIILLFYPRILNFFLLLTKPEKTINKYT